MLLSNAVLQLLSNAVQQLLVLVSSALQLQAQCHCPLLKKQAHLVFQMEMVLQVLPVLVLESHPQVKLLHLLLPRLPLMMRVQLDHQLVLQVLPVLILESHPQVKMLNRESPGKSPGNSLEDFNKSVSPLSFDMF